MIAFATFLIKLSQNCPILRVFMCIFFKNFHIFICFQKLNLVPPTKFYDKRLTFFLNSLAKVLLFFIEIGTMEVRKILEESNGMDNSTSVQTI